MDVLDPPRARNRPTRLLRVQAGGHPKRKSPSRGESVRVRSREGGALGRLCLAISFEIGGGLLVPAVPEDLPR